MNFFHFGDVHGKRATDNMTTAVFVWRVGYARILLYLHGQYKWMSTKNERVQYRQLRFLIIIRTNDTLRHAVQRVLKLKC